MTLKSQPNRPMCGECGLNAARSNGVSKNGYTRWQKLCSVCSKTVYTRDLKDQVCHRCGFEAEDRCQMCLIGGETICQNCNTLRLKVARHKGLTVDATVIPWDTRI